MTDLPASTWREIEKAAIYLPGQSSVGRYIGVGTLKTILKKSKRSDQQNKTLWGVVYPQIRRHTPAFTDEEIHDFFLIEYFGSETVEIFGRKKLRPLRRSSRLTKSEFADYMDFVVRFMAQKGVVIELPGEHELRHTG